MKHIYHIDFESPNNTNAVASSMTSRNVIPEYPGVTLGGTRVGRKHERKFPQYSGFIINSIMSIRVR